MPNLPYPKKVIIEDYRTAFRSRTVSLVSRKEVFMGKAKFGIFGDGKEIPQVAMAHTFKEGDFRAGYYRDQTFMFATGMITYEQFFAQLYADTNVENEPASAGRQMNCHFATRFLDENGNFIDLTKSKNCAADLSPTGAQMAKSLGLAYASKLYREIPELKNAQKVFSKNGNEVAFTTIGNASTSEGIFFESVNAAGVLQIPMAISVWDDGFGISVGNEFQTTKESISDALEGFRETESHEGFKIFHIKGWEYATLCETYKNGVEEIRKNHTPAIFHIYELTQPQGHSTSGSHERYKTKERLDWEKEFDGIARMRKWLIQNEIISESEIEAIEKEDKIFVGEAKDLAWEKYISPIKNDLNTFVEKIENVAKNPYISENIKNKIQDEVSKLKAMQSPYRRELLKSAKKILITTKDLSSKARTDLLEFSQNFYTENEKKYVSNHFSTSTDSPFNVESIAPKYSESSEKVDGRILIKECFNKNMERDSRIFAIGEDIGQMGGVNLGFENLQEKFGLLRITDTGIREASIVGQGIGTAMRGLRPIVDIQYLDYLPYALQIISDDLATLQYRTKGGQKSPLIIRTKGHRLEGIWHSGSPMAMILNAVRGVHLLVPRNMTQASGFYNTLFRSDDPAILVEVLNGYRTKELLPNNIGEFTLAFGIPETLQEGTDITVVTYGACCKIAGEASLLLEEVGISIEIIDVQTLLPFDLEYKIAESLKKTNRVIFFDEDMPGGTTAFMMQNVLEEQKGYFFLDSEPRTLSAKPNRPAYGTDGDYFTKPSAEDLFDIAYALMNEANPSKFPKVF